MSVTCEAAVKCVLPVVRAMVAKDFSELVSLQGMMFLFTKK